MNLSINWQALAFSLSLSVLAMFGVINQMAAQCHPSDFNALKALYESTGGDNWKNNALWEMVSENESPLPDCDLSALPGVSINTENRVINISLFDNNLSGELPKSLNLLTELKVLSFSNNNLNGTLPEEIGALSNLTELSLSNNNFTGALPESIANLKKLVILFLDNNQFSGAIPAGLTGLNRLEWVYAEKNQFSGNLPNGFSNLRNLTFLLLYQNNLEGDIPRDLDSLENLKWLLLHQNNLSGCYPDNLCSLNLDSINLSENPKLPNFGNYEVIDSLCTNPAVQIGLTCNDGDENTINDLIQEDCTCQGELMISIDEVNQANTFKLFPNPVFDFIHLSKKNNKFKIIQIINLEGNIVSSIQSTNQSTIEVQHLPSGKYFMQFIQADSKPSVIPFIKL